MSDEMAVGDNATGDENIVNRGDTTAENIEATVEASPQPSGESLIEKTEETTAPLEGSPVPESIEDKERADIFNEDKDNEEKVSEDIITPKTEEEKLSDEVRGVKRRASIAFSDPGDEEFKGFDHMKQDDLSKDYKCVLERLEIEVQTAIKEFKPIRSFKASLSAKAGKRPRQDTDGSRPSSALSTRSDGEWAEQAGTSPGARGRRSTTEMSSPLLRAPLERGWRRELVYRAALDAHSRRNADVYYYTPYGKKLRSTREVAEHLSGTGLTLENFSFFKESLGVDDPEKEIIRDAKLMRRVESPVPAPQPATEGKRTPKPKPPKGASPEPATPKSPPSKLKVKSMGSRLSTATPPTASAPKQSRRLQAAAAAAAAPVPVPTPAPVPATASTTAQEPATAPATANATASAPVAAATPTTTPDNNNSATWKKPRAAGASQPPPLQPPLPAPLPLPSQPPPPLQSRPQQQTRTDTDVQKSTRQVVQPCSMSCGRGAVPSLACAACLCLYHPVCAGLPHAQTHHHKNFLCKNCRKSTSPPLEPPPLTHKSGATASAANVTTAGAGTGAALQPRRAAPPVPSPVPVPVPVPAKVRPDKRVLLRMKVKGGGADGTRVWAVAAPTVGSGACNTGTAAPAGVRPTLPQSLAVLNGRRFIVVPRSLVHSDPH